MDLQLTKTSKLQVEGPIKATFQIRITADEYEDSNSATFHQLQASIIEAGIPGEQLHFNAVIRFGKLHLRDMTVLQSEMYYQYHEPPKRKYCWFWVRDFLYRFFYHLINMKRVFIIQHMSMDGPRHFFELNTRKHQKRSFILHLESLRGSKVLQVQFGVISGQKNFMQWRPHPYLTLLEFGNIQNISTCWEGTQDLQCWAMKRKKGTLMRTMKMSRLLVG